MPRAVDGTRRSDRRRKYLEITKGFRGRAKSNFRTAKDAAAKAPGEYRDIDAFGVNSKLSYLTHIIRQRDYEEMKKFIDALRVNIED